MEYVHTSLFLLLLFCSPWTSVGKIYFTHLGTECETACLFSDGDYKCWITKQNGNFEPMYFSPQENFDYRNNKCSGICEKNGENYYWCKTGGFSWGYCGLVEIGNIMETEHIHHTKDQHKCGGECQYYESKNYYWCDTWPHIGWDYCSPKVDVTYRGKPCRSDHSCGLHGESYNWCWTSQSDYDYCGPIETYQINSKDVWAK